MCTALAGAHGTTFAVRHFMGEVWYDTSNFIRSNRNQRLPESIENLLARSSLSTLRGMHDVSPNMATRVVPAPSNVDTWPQTSSEKPTKVAVDCRSQLASFGLSRILSEVCELLEAPHSDPQYVMCVKPNLYGMRPIDGVVAFDAAIVERQLQSWDLVRLCRSLRDAKIKDRSRRIFSQPTSSLRFNGRHFQVARPAGPDSVGQSLYAAHLHPDATDQSHGFHAYNSAAVDRLTSSKKKKTTGTSEGSHAPVTPPTLPRVFLPEHSTNTISPTVVHESLRQPHEFMDKKSSWGVRPQPDFSKADPGSDVDQEDHDMPSNDNSAAKEPSSPAQRPTPKHLETKAENQSKEETQPSTMIQTSKVQSDASLVEITNKIFDKAKSNGKHAVRRFQLVRTLASEPSVLLALGLPESASRADVKALVETIDSAQGSMITREEFEAFVQRMSDFTTSPDSKNDIDTKTNVSIEPDKDASTVLSASTDAHDTNIILNGNADAVLSSNDEINEAGNYLEQRDSPQDMQYCTELVDDCLAGINALARTC